MVFLKATFNSYQLKNEKLSLVSLKPTQMPAKLQNLFQYSFDIKIKKIQVINMVPLNRLFFTDISKLLRGIQLHVGTVYALNPINCK